MLFENEKGVFLHVNEVEDMDGIHDRLRANLPDFELVQSKTLPDQADDEDD